MSSARVHRFSKIRHIAALLGVVCLCAGCGSLDRSELFATGRDARTYNPQTGRYEWPDDEPSRRPAQSRAAARGSHAAPERNDIGPDDGRVFNPLKGRFECVSE